MCGFVGSMKLDPEHQKAKVCVSDERRTTRGELQPGTREPVKTTRRLYLL
jgi:hypothetical protein